MAELISAFEIPARQRVLLGERRPAVQELQLRRVRGELGEAKRSSERRAAVAHEVHSMT